MTIKEISELCGVEPHTIRNWINRDDFLKENFTLRIAIKEKLEKGAPETPADFDFNETVEIISEGGNKTLAALLRENAANKDALAVQGGNNPIAALVGLPALLERIKGRLDDPREAAYRELEEFVKRTITTEESPIHKEYLIRLYHAYKKEVEKPLDKHVFMHKIAMDHPEFKLKYDRHGWYFAHCYTIRII